MGFFLNFYFDKIFIYFFIRALSFLLRRIIRIYYSELFINQIFSLFIMFLGESLSFFLWIILKFKLPKSSKDKNIEEENVKKSCLKRYKIPFFMFFCSFCDFCGSFNYYDYYSYSILKFSDNFDNLNKIFLCLFVTTMKYIF